MTLRILYDFSETDPQIYEAWFPPPTVEAGVEWVRKNKASLHRAAICQGNVSLLDIPNYLLKAL